VELCEVYSPKLCKSYPQNYFHYSSGVGADRAVRWDEQMMAASESGRTAQSLRGLWQQSHHSRVTRSVH